jgi:hypothetical protein
MPGGRTQYSPPWHSHAADAPLLLLPVEPVSPVLPEEASPVDPVDPVAASPVVSPVDPPSLEPGSVDVDVDVDVDVEVDVEVPGLVALPSVGPSVPEVDSSSIPAASSAHAAAATRITKVITRTIRSLMPNLASARNRDACRRPSDREVATLVGLRHRPASRSPLSPRPAGVSLLARHVLWAEQQQGTARFHVEKAELQ